MSDFPAHSASGAGAPMTDIAALVSPQRGPRFASLIVVLIVAVLAGSLFYWAQVATLEIWATGIGRVIPSRQIQVVQNLEGGIVTEVLVGEGDAVTSGEIIARIDSTDAQSSYLQDRSNWAALTALTDRLAAEASGMELVFSPALDDGSAAAREAKASEQAAFVARRDALRSGLAVLDAQRTRQVRAATDARAQIEQLGTTRGLVDEQLSVVRPQVEKGLVSRTELLRLERELADVDQRRTELQAGVNAAESDAAETAARIAEKTDAFRADAFAALSEARASLAALSEKLIASRDRVVRRDVRAPVDGVVKRVLVTTEGEVVKPGDTIVEIVPSNDDLFIEVRIRPQDIGFIRKGQEASVRLTAYDSSIYGAMIGRVERVGADTITTNEGESFYPVVVIVDPEQGIESRTAELEILPGMIADVSIVTGERTILDYVFKPILKLRDTAFRDR